jgi:ribosome maturation factor RimP
MAVLDEVRDLAGAVVRQRSLRLWDVEIGGQPGRSVVRIFVDAEGGIDLDTVAQVSEEISRALDLKDTIPGRYTLEVSSPGLERNLKSPEHFQACKGLTAVVKTKERMVADSHRLEGVIADAGPESVRIETPLQQVEVPYGEIKSARTLFEWK